MEAAAVVVEVQEELFGRDVHVKRSVVAEVTIPDLVHGFTDELSCVAFGCFVGSKVTNKDGVFGFLASLDNCCCCIVDDGICRRAWQRWERCTTSSHVQSGWLNESDEIVCAILIVGNVEEGGIDDIAQRGEVVVAGLA